MKIIVKLFLVAALVAVIVLGYLKFTDQYRSVSGNPEIKSGISGYCLDDHHDGNGINSLVDSWQCNGRKSQTWTVTGNTIRHSPTSCLSILNNNTASGSPIVLNKCNGTAGQIWTISGDGYQNPASGLCLSMPGNKTTVQLIIASCNNLSDQDEAWMTAFWGVGTAPNSPCTGTEGQKVACIAEQQYSLWESYPSKHGALLSVYSDGNGYEEWCADFVSYVYKQAGFPFSLGERKGWDEYNANNIQYMGFTKHMAASGYIPQVGDVAFFNYSGGHVEIVVNGGKSPTFVYGDSGVTDPSTGNGAMQEDTITNDGSAGQVIYYLSPS